MSIIGNKISLDSKGIQAPYVEYKKTFYPETASGGTIRYVNILHNFDHIPDYLLYKKAYEGLDFRQSPNIRYIGDYAFYNDYSGGPRSFYRGEIPDSVETIGAYAFYSLYQFAVADGAIAFTKLPNVLRSIGDYAFGCGSSSVTATTCIVFPSLLEFPLTFTSLGAFAFKNNKSLIEVVFNAQLSFLGNQCFDGCNNLTTVTCKATTPPTLSSSFGLGTVSALAHIYVPAASVSVYQAATNWTKYSSIISAIPT